MLYLDRRRQHVHDYGAGVWYVCLRQACDKLASCRCSWGRAARTARTDISTLQSVCPVRLALPLCAWPVLMAYVRGRGSAMCVRAKRRL